MTAPEVQTPALTARGLLASVESFGPVVEADALAFGSDPPAELDPLLCVLHTGLRAILTGRKWFGSTVADGKRPQVVELDPDKPIPPRIALVCVEGDARWHRVRPDARIDLPELFA